MERSTMAQVRFGLDTAFVRLPGEAEWKYAHWAGSTTLYSFSHAPEQPGRYGWRRESLHAPSAEHDSRTLMEIEPSDAQGST